MQNIRGNNTVRQPTWNRLYHELNGTVAAPYTVGLGLAFASPGGIPRTGAMGHRKKSAAVLQGPSS